MCSPPGQELCQESTLHKLTHPRSLTFYFSVKSGLHTFRRSSQRECGNSKVCFRFGLTGNRVSFGKTHSVLHIKGEVAHRSSLLFSVHFKWISLSPFRKLWTCYSLKRKMAVLMRSCALLLVAMAVGCIQLYHGELLFTLQPS